LGPDLIIKPYGAFKEVTEETMKRRRQIYQRMNGANSKKSVQQVSVAVTVGLANAAGTAL
jgi:hypothetical protein